MPLQAAELSTTAKQELLTRIRAQMDASQYELLVGQYGEDALIERVLTVMEAGPRHPESLKLTRGGGLVAGIMLGLIAGFLFWLAGWLLNALFSIPMQYSLSALTIGSIFTIPTGLLLANWQKPENSPFDFRVAFRWYCLGSLVGGSLGVSRWVFHYEDSILEIVNKAAVVFYDNCVASIIAIAFIIAAIAWIVSLGKTTGVFDFVSTMILLPVFVIWVVGIVLGGLADTPLWEHNGVSIIKQNMGAAALIVPIVLGGFLGFCWPPQVPANRSLG